MTPLAAVLLAWRGGALERGKFAHVALESSGGNRRVRSHNSTRRNDAALLGYLVNGLNGFLTRDRAGRSGAPRPKVVASALAGVLDVARPIVRDAFGLPELDQARKGLCCIRIQDLASSATDSRAVLCADSPRTHQNDEFRCLPTMYVDSSLRRCQQSQQAGAFWPSLRSLAGCRTRLKIRGFRACRFGSGGGHQSIFENLGVFTIRESICSSII